MRRENKTIVHEIWSYDTENLMGGQFSLARVPHMWVIDAPNADVICPSAVAPAYTLTAMSYRSMCYSCESSNKVQFARRSIKSRTPRPAMITLWPLRIYAKGLTLRNATSVSTSLSNEHKILDMQGHRWRTNFCIPLSKNGKPPVKIYVPST